MRVLVIEDVPRTALVLQRGLIEEGYTVDVAVDGPTGLWQGTEFAYEAIILDLMLPGIDGLEVCRRLRAADVWAPILILTAREGVHDRVAGLDAGADDFVGKPFSVAEIGARLRALARRGDGPRPAVLEVGDLRLDPASRSVRRGAVELGLTPREYALLELFMRHPGEVLSRSRILDSIWDFAYAGTSNVVDQYVAALRRKIDRPFGCNELETVRGAGYRLHTGVRR